MTISPELEIQGWLIDRLKGSADVMALVDGVHDFPPADRWSRPKQGNITLGPTDSIDDGADCIDGILHTAQVDVWSRKVGMPECKKICTAVKRAVVGAAFDLAENALVDVRLVMQRTLRDPDGLTNHGVLQFEFRVEDLTDA